MKYVIFNKRNELIRVPIALAMFYEAYGNYCYGVFPNKQKIMLPVSLGKLEKMIRSIKETQDSVFIRIGKRFIVNMNVVAKVDITKQQLILSDFTHPGNFVLPVSKEALKQIRDLYIENKIWK